MVQQMQSMCRECNGEGELINEQDRCKACKGKKTTKQTKKIEVNVDKGMHDSQKITFRGESNQEVRDSFDAFFARHYFRAKMSSKIYVSLEQSLVI
jgi:DnaJ-class molecular chaperone